MHDVIQPVTRPLQDAVLSTSGQLLAAGLVAGCATALVLGQFAMLRRASRRIDQLEEFVPQDAAEAYAMGYAAGRVRSGARPLRLA